MQNNTLIFELESTRLADGAQVWWGFSSGLGVRHNGIYHYPLFAPGDDQGALLERVLFTRPGQFGLNALSYGAIKVLADRDVRALALDYAVDGHQFIVYRGDEADPAGWQLELRAIAERVTRDDDHLTIHLLDRLAELQRPLCRSRLAGSSAGGVGLEGDESQRDTPRPQLYGSVRNLAPVLANAQLGIYLVCANTAAVTRVRHRGAVLTRHADPASFAAFMATQPTGGWSRYAGPEGAFIRLGIAITGQLTCDAATTETRAAPLIRRAMLDAGVAEADIYISDVDALATLCPAAVGLLASGTDTALDVVNRLANSVGISVTPNRLGVYRMQRVDAPNGTPVLEIRDWNSIEVVASGADDRGIPASAVTLEYDHNPTVLSEVAGEVLESEPAFATWARSGSRQVNLAAADVPALAAIASRHRLAQPLQFSTCLCERPAAQVEAGRLLDLFGRPRRILRIQTTYPDGVPAELDLGVEVRLWSHDYGWGWLGRVISIRPDSLDGDVSMLVWG